MKKIHLSFNNDLKRGVGNICLTIASLLFVFVAVDSVVDMSKYVNDTSRIVYWGLTAFFFAAGCYILATIEPSIVDELGYCRVEIMRMPNIRIMPPYSDPMIEHSAQGDKRKSDVKRQNRRKAKSRNSNTK